MNALFPGSDICSVCSREVCIIFG
uniref:Uncharacterized protein n=1 Tax=Rhizophora mucronata TaxID=61149 RepID=A0A2P2Q8T3_RHIMU